MDFNGDLMVIFMDFNGDSNGVFSWILMVILIVI